MSATAALLAGIAAAAASLPIALGALIASRAFGCAAVRYRLLALAFGLCVLAAPLTYALSFRPQAGPLQPAGGATAALAPAPLPAVPLLVVGAAVAALLLLSLVRDVVRLRRVKCGAVPLASAIVRASRPRTASIATSDRVLTPTAVGYVHPAVILPRDFRARVDDAEWDAVLAHECAHLARRDDWAKALQSAFSRAAWWLPGLWLLSRALDLERELASDEHAAGHAGPRRYAACLLRLATHRGGDAVAVAFGARRSHVAIRVERLVRPTSAARPLARAAALGAFTAVALASLVCAALSVPGHGPRPVALARAPRAATPPEARAAVAAARDARTPRRLGARPGSEPAIRNAAALARADAPAPPAAAPRQTAPVKVAVASVKDGPCERVAAAHRLAHRRHLRIVAAAHRPAPEARLAAAPAAHGTSVPVAVRVAPDDGHGGGAPGTPVAGAAAAEAIAPADPVTAQARGVVPEVGLPSPPST